MRSVFSDSMVFLFVLGSFAGCAGSKSYLADQGAELPVRAEDAGTLRTEAPSSSVGLTSDVVARIKARQSEAAAPGTPEEQPSTIQTVSHEPAWDQPENAPGDATLTIDGRTYRMQLVDQTAKSQSSSLIQTASQTSTSNPAMVPPIVSGTTAITQPDIVSTTSATAAGGETLQLNLPTALSMIGGQHPVVGFAQWRVQEAYAALEQAEILWLPSIRTGFSFHRHDGNYQASNGSIVDVNRNSFQYGLGAGSTGAGTTPNPGIVAQFHLADAIFQPEVARKTAWARGHAANATMNQQLLTVALAYLELLDAEQDLKIIQQSQLNASAVAKLTGDFAAAGQGLQADADRLETELRMIENRLASGRERVSVASARLSQALSLDSNRRIRPLDPTVVPIDLVSLNQDSGTLVSTGLSNRPELKEAQALVAAACDRFQRQKYAAFVPSVLLGFSTGGSGGGVGNNLSNVDDRYDIDAMVTWEIRNLGFGERAARRQTEAQVQQAKYQKIRLLDQVARQISEAHTQAMHRSERISITQSAIQSAQDSYERNLSRIRDGQGLPLEVLQSVQALESARRAYLQSVVAYNEAQFRLQWSLGWPVFTKDGGQ